MRDLKKNPHYRLHVSNPIPQIFNMINTGYKLL